MKASDYYTKSLRRLEKNLIPGGNGMRTRKQTCTNERDLNAALASLNEAAEFKRTGIHQEGLRRGTGGGLAEVLPLTRRRFLF